MSGGARRKKNLNSQFEKMPKLYAGGVSGKVGLSEGLFDLKAYFILRVA